MRKSVAFINRITIHAYFHGCHLSVKPYPCTCILPWLPSVCETKSLYLYTCTSMATSVCETVSLYLHTSMAAIGLWNRIIVPAYFHDCNRSVKLNHCTGIRPWLQFICEAEALYIHTSLAAIRLRTSILGHGCIRGVCNTSYSDSDVSEFVWI